MQVLNLVDQFLVINAIVEQGTHKVKQVLKQHHQFLKCYSQMFDDSVLLVRVSWSGPVVHLSS